MFANLLGTAVQPGPRRRTRRVQRGVAPLQRIVYAVRNPGPQVVGVCTTRQPGIVACLEHVCGARVACCRCCSRCCAKHINGALRSRQNAPPSIAAEASPAAMGSAGRAAAASRRRRPPPSTAGPRKSSKLLKYCAECGNAA